MRKYLLLILISMLALPSAALQAQERKKVVIRDGKVIEREGDIIVAGPGEIFGKRAFLGVTTLELSADLRTHFGVPKDAGVMVSTVSPDSPAAKAGLKAGDIITAVDGTKVDSPMALSRALREKEKGQQVRVEFRRDSANQQALATLAEREGLNIPEIRINGDRLGEPLFIGTEAIKDIETYFNSPEWKAKVESLQDCGNVQSRVRDLEKRLQDLEKKLNSK